MAHAASLSAAETLQRSSRGSDPMPRAAADPMPRPALPSIDEVISAEKPCEPVHCLRPNTVRAQAQAFLQTFPGTVLYAVKANPDAAVLQALADAGISHFDVASLTEARTVRQLLPEAHLHFMHPVKSRSAIAAVYGEHGIRDFCFDNSEELAKIYEETGHARDLGLYLRLALPPTGAVHELSGKFGAEPAAAVRLLRRARQRARRLGVCFHVGSQCLDPEAYVRAIRRAAEVIAQAGVPVDCFDIGGGFPVSYADQTPPPLEAYADAVRAALAEHPILAESALWCEPGRALVAPGVSVVVQVWARRGSTLYINDGVFGSLFDAGATERVRFPARLIRAGRRAPAVAPAPFRLYGPTCDSCDQMDGPFFLPNDVTEGDWIELAQLGAYGSCFRTSFNGFGGAQVVEVRDPPLVPTPGYPQDAPVGDGRIP